MCGIAGFWQTSGATLDNSIDQDYIFAALKHRGPDDKGIWKSDDSRAVLLQTRLSIIDLSDHGHQPMVSHSSRYVISYNGEIYNHEEIRVELINQGVYFSGRSDTEVLVEAFDKWGVPNTLAKLNGMFSVALYDRKTGSLTLARDRLGEKPMYFGSIDGKVFFASELKAFQGWRDFNDEIDSLSISQYLHYGFIPAPQSIFSHVKKLLPGHYVTFDAKLLPEQTRFWDIAKIASQSAANKLSRPEALPKLESLLLDSVNLRMKSDVRTGTFLSGGVDSALITALIQSQSNIKFDSYTISFGEKEFDEGPAARKIADYIGTNHNEIKISEAELLNIVPQLSQIYCEPFADESQIPTVLVSEMAAKEVKVILSGDGGDELFGGYNRHIASSSMEKIRKVISAKAIKRFSPLFTARVRHFLQRILKQFGYQINFGQLYRLVNAFGAEGDLQVYQNLLKYDDFGTYGNYDYMPPYVEVFSKEFKGLSLSESIMAYDQMFYLPDNILAKVDRASMSSSLETRVPFLDHRLVEFSWELKVEDKIAGGVGKTILRDLLYKYVPRKLFSNNKLGFDVPLCDWLRGPLKDWSHALIYDNPHIGIVDVDLAKKLWVCHVEKKEDRAKELWKILMLLSWLKAWKS